MEYYGYFSETCLCSSLRINMISLELTWFTIRPVRLHRDCESVAAVVENNKDIYTSTGCKYNLKHFFFMMLVRNHRPSFSERRPQTFPPAPVTWLPHPPAHLFSRSLISPAVYNWPISTHSLPDCLSCVCGVTNLHLHPNANLFLALVSCYLFCLLISCLFFTCCAF